MPDHPETPEVLIEETARALFENKPTRTMEWDDLGEWIRDSWRREARDVLPAAPAIRKQAQEALAKQFDFEAERLKHVVNIDGLSPAERSTIHGERLAYGAAARLCRGEQIIDQAARERREVELARQQERQRIREALEEEVRQRATGDWGEYEQGFLAGLRFLDSLEDDDA